MPQIKMQSTMAGPDVPGFVVHRDQIVTVTEAQAKDLVAGRYGTRVETGILHAVERAVTRKPKDE